METIALVMLAVSQLLTFHSEYSLEYGAYCTAEMTILDVGYLATAMPNNSVTAVTAFQGDTHTTWMLKNDTLVDNGVVSPLTETVETMSFAVRRYCDDTEGRTAWNVY